MMKSHQKSQKHTIHIGVSYRRLMLLYVFLLCVTALGSCQQGGWAPIPAEEMAFKDDPTSAGAPAVILLMEQISDDKRGTTTEHVRIKVLKDSGKKYADIEIPTAKWLKIDSIEARTIRPDGIVVPFNGTIHEKTVEKTRKSQVLVKAFTLPDVEVGSIIEYRFRARIEKIIHPEHTWNIQSELFTRKAHFELRPTSFDNLSVISQNFDQKPQKNGDTISLDVSNVAGIEEEKLTLPQSELGSSISISYRWPEYPTPESYWAWIAQYYGEQVNQFAGKDKQLKSVVASIAPPSDPPEMRLQKCYARAQQVRKLRDYYWDSTEAKQEKQKEDKHAGEVLERGYGTLSDISALFVAMARDLGYEAGLVFLTDRKEGLFHQEVMSVRQLTAIMTWVEKDNKFMLLDPACEKCPFGLISWDQAGASGIRTNYSGSVFVRIPANKPEDATYARKGDLKLDGEGTLSGTLLVTIDGLEALELRNREEKSDEANKKKTVVDLVKTWLPSMAEVNLDRLNGWDNIDKPIVAELAITVPGFASVTGKRLMMPTWLFAAAEQNPFPHAGRKYAVVFENPYQRRDEFTIAIPKGYQVENLPPEKHSSGAFLDYSLKMTSDGSKIHLTRILVNHALYVSVQYYRQLQEDFNLVKTNDAQQTILRQWTVASR